MKGSATDEQVQEIAKNVLLSPDEVKMWLDHLQTVRDNRRRGAQKAAETRKKKTVKKSFHDAYFCGTCHDQYMEYTDEEENWIECELCSTWFHFTYVGIQSQAVPQTFYCEDCR